ncbi:MAG TPA: hypothetical protein VGD37_08340 [Kofleriaceae bacterium]|jgi:hypothetical protein
MPDRIDIDALLIGALYGELTPADEARLTAHLESHPTDRTALADMTRTRAAVRDSRILASQFEPPQSISAMLLREAARRAPEPRGSEEGSWLQRFVRSFLAHPAMAAAAVLVLVVGVAGTLYVRGIDPHYAASPPETAVAPSAKQEMAAAPSVAAQSPAGMAAPESETATAADHAAAGSAIGAGGDAVDVDDLAKGQAGTREGLAKQDADSPAKLKVARTGRADQVLTPPAPRAEPARKAAAAPPMDVPAPAPRATRSAQPARTDQGDERAKPDKKSAGIVLRTPELALKENDDEAQEPRRQTDNADGTRPRLRGAGPAPGGAAGGAPTTTTPSAAAASAEPAPPPPSSSSVASAASNPRRPASPPAAAPRPAPATGESLNDARDRFADKPASKDAKASEKTGEKTSEKMIEQKPAQSRAVLDWARKQHGQVTALVGANNCRAAATAAIAIYSRAPDYYASNVATDISIKPCLAYLNREREREERSRAAAKNAASDTPAEAPARK